MNQNDTKLVAKIILESIQNNALSLSAQLTEYDFLKISVKQATELNKIEKQFHDLVKEIVK